MPVRREVKTLEDGESRVWRSFCTSLERLQWLPYSLLASCSLWAELLPSTTNFCRDLLTGQWTNTKQTNQSIENKVSMGRDYWNHKPKWIFLAFKPPFSESISGHRRNHALLCRSTLAPLPAQPGIWKRANRTEHFYLLQQPYWRTFNSLIKLVDKIINVVNPSFPNIPLNLLD